MRRLYRSSTDKKIMGVCGGMAEYFGIDSTVVRVIGLLLMFTPFMIPLYIALGIILPTDYTVARGGTNPRRTARNQEDWVNDIRSAADQIRQQAQELKYQARKQHRDRFDRDAEEATSRRTRRDVTSSEDDWSDF